MVAMVSLLPSGRVPYKKYLDTNNQVSMPLTNLVTMDNIPEFSRSTRPGTRSDQGEAVPIVNAVAVKPLISVSEDGETF
jgi:hypothetical protein